MSESIAVRMPLTVPSSFVVATSAPPAEPVAVAARRLHPGLSVPLRQAARELLAGPLLQGAVLPVDASPWRAALLGAARTTALRELLGAATHHIVLTSHAPPHAQPGQAQALRAIARGLALATDGVVHDPLTGTLIGPAARGDVEPAAFRLADDWLATAIAPAPADHPPPTGRDPAEPDRQVTATTRGLTRFGLPELLAAEVCAEHLLVAVNLLRGVAVHLLATHWAWLTAGGGPIRRIAARPRIGAAEMYQYWGRAGLELWRGRRQATAPPATDAVEVHLAPPCPSTPDPVVVGDVVIRVGPPGGGGARAMAAWLGGDVEPIRPKGVGGRGQEVQKRKS